MAGTFHSDSTPREADESIHSSTALFLPRTVSLNGVAKYLINTSNHLGADGALLVENGALLL